MGMGVRGVRIVTWHRNSCMVMGCVKERLSRGQVDNKKCQRSVRYDVGGQS